MRTIQVKRYPARKDGDISYSTLVVNDDGTLKVLGTMCHGDIISIEGLDLNVAKVYGKEEHKKTT